MMHMIKHTFISPLSNTEVVALAISHWPMPCVISIVKEVQYDADCFFRRNERMLPKSVRRYLNKRNRRRR